MPLAISLLSGLLASVSLVFAVYSWRQANRPLVTVQIESASGGNLGIALNLVVENTGTRPAKDIRIRAVRSDVVDALRVPAELPMDAQRCLFGTVPIPLLIHGRRISNAFGYLGTTEGAWRSGATIPVIVEYSDLGARTYTTHLRLLLADDAGFAQTHWDRDRSSSA